MREDGKRNFLGIVMGGCGRYVCCFVFVLFWGGDGEGCFGSEMEWNDDV